MNVTKLKHLIDQGMKYVQVIVSGRSAKEKRANLRRIIAKGSGYDRMVNTTGWVDFDAWMGRQEDDLATKLLERETAAADLPEITAELRVFKRIKDHVALMIVQKEKATEDLVKLKPEE